MCNVHLARCLSRTGPKPPGWNLISSPSGCRKNRLRFAAAAAAGAPCLCATTTRQNRRGAGPAELGRPPQSRRETQGQSHVSVASASAVSSRLVPHLRGPNVTPPLPGLETASFPSACAWPILPVHRRSDGHRREELVATVDRERVQ